MSTLPPELLEKYLSFYQDIGIKALYLRDPQSNAAVGAESDDAAGADAVPVDAAPGTGVPVGAVFSGSVPAAPLEAVPLDATPAKGVPAGAVFSGAVPAEPAPAEAAAPVLSVAKQLEIIREEIGDCRRCPLHEGRNKLVFGVGDPEAKLVFVGEGPGADEDAQGIPFVGRAGQLLTQMIEGTAQKEGIPLERRDVYICNVVKCRPPQNRTPEPDEMAICGEFLFRQLEAIRPKAICVLGATAMRALLGIEGITRNRGQWHKWRGMPVMITYHPSYLLRPYNQNAKREAWEDLKKVLHYVYD